MYIYCGHAGEDSRARRHRGDFYYCIFYYRGTVILVYTADMQARIAELGGIEEIICATQTHVRNGGCMQVLSLLALLVQKYKTDAALAAYALCRSARWRSATWRATRRTRCPYPKPETRNPKP